LEVLVTVRCPVCRSPAGDGKHFGDNTTFRCPKCGDYKMSDTLLELIKNKTAKLPTPEAFKELVKKNRGKSTEWPIVTQYDLPA